MPASGPRHLHGRGLHDWRDYLLHRGSSFELRRIASHAPPDSARGLLAPAAVEALERCIDSVGRSVGGAEAVGLAKAANEKLAEEFAAQHCRLGDALTRVRAERQALRELARKVVRARLGRTARARLQRTAAHRHEWAMRETTKQYLHLAGVVFREDADALEQRLLRVQSCTHLSELVPLLADQEPHEQADARGL